MPLRVLLHRLGEDRQIDTRVHPREPHQRRRRVHDERAEPDRRRRMPPHPRPHPRPTQPRDHTPQPRAPPARQRVPRGRRDPIALEGDRHRRPSGRASSRPHPAADIESPCPATMHVMVRPGPGPGPRAPLHPVTNATGERPTARVDPARESTCRRRGRQCRRFRSVSGEEQRRRGCNDSAEGALDRTVPDDHQEADGDRHEPDRAPPPWPRRQPRGLADLDRRRRRLIRRRG